MEADTGPTDWAVYRIGQEIFRRHIPLIGRGDWLLKSDNMVFEVINEARPFNVLGIHPEAFVLALSRGPGTTEQDRLVRGVGHVAILEYRLTVEYPTGPELYLELHIRLKGRDIGSAIPVAYFEKWFPETSCLLPFRDGDLAKIDPHFHIVWRELFPDRDHMSGAYRTTLVPGKTRVCYVEFYQPFPMIPTVKLLLLSRNVPIWVTIRVQIETRDITQRGFSMCLSIAENEPIHRVVVGWEAMEPRVPQLPANPVPAYQ